jgi:hypothetical protein
MTALSSYEEHILELWYEAGTVVQGANGLTALDWPMIVSWADRFHSEKYTKWVKHQARKGQKITRVPVEVTQCTLLEYELQLIQTLSKEYCSQYSLSYEPSCECPKLVELDEVTEDDALANANAIAEGLKSLFSAPQDTSVEAVVNK